MDCKDPTTLELDAREILRYLNDLGIRNISGEALRDFITDLKKLIKYDIEYKNKATEESHELRGPERLHSASTFSSRTRSRRRDQPPGVCHRECRRGKENQPIRTRNAVSAPILRDTVQVPPRRACSCTRAEYTEKRQNIDKRKGVTSSSNLIKVPIVQPQKKADPVSLYHYYLSLWDKYKANVPGENSWAELRWSIRQKLAGDIKRPTQRKAAPPTGKELEKRRQGWVD